MRHSNGCLLLLRDDLTTCTCGLGPVHEWDGQQIQIAVINQWRFDLFMPVPTTWPYVPCPFGHRETQVRHWQFHDAPRGRAARVSHRCDVSFKCGRCSVVWTRAPALTKEQFDHFTKELSGARRIAWTQAAQIMEVEMP